MCVLQCVERLLERSEQCESCQRETADDWDSQFADVATRAIESLTVAELLEIEREFRQHYAGFQFHGLEGARA